MKNTNSKAQKDVHPFNVVSGLRSPPSFSRQEDGDHDTDNVVADRVAGSSLNTFNSGIAPIYASPDGLQGGWLLANRAAILGSPRIGSIDYKTNDSSDTKKIENILQGARTAYDSMNHQGDGGTGVLRCPAAVMPPLDALFSKAKFGSVLSDNSGGDASTKEDSGQLYDPMHGASCSVSYDAPGNAPVPKYNNTVLMKRGLWTTKRIDEENNTVLQGKTPKKQKLSHLNPASATPPSIAKTFGSPGGNASLMSQSPPLELNMYLSEQLCDVLQRDGMPATMYEWQAQCLTMDEGLLSNQKNLVVAAPTSSGKTLIAEILMLRAIANDQRGRKALFILPYVALCHEKAAKLSKLLIPMGRQLKRAYGNEYSENILDADGGVIVCTPENANTIVNRIILSKSKIHEEICCVVVDELHLVGKDDRGTLMEILISKIMYHASLVSAEERALVKTSTPSMRNTPSNQLSMPIDPTFIQIIGLTATLPNIDDMCQWLNALKYVSEFRPVPLKEFLKSGQQLLFKAPDGKLQLCKDLPQATEDDPDHVAYLTKDAIDQQKSVLVFCATREYCEKQARSLSTYLGKFHNLTPAESIKGIRNTISKSLCDQGFKYSFALGELVKAGIAYHHGDLTMTERKIIEDAYRQGHIRVICATSTLGTGVNLPVFRVIFCDAHQGKFEVQNFLKPETYCQISGRAGRTGVDAWGESILISKHNNPAIQNHLRKLLHSDLSRIESTMKGLEPRRLRQFLLEMIATSSHAISQDMMGQILSLTLLHSSFRSDSREQMTKAIGKEIENLRKPSSNDPLESCINQPLLVKYGITYTATALGIAVVESGMSPDEALLYLEYLRRTLKEGFVLGTCLHAGYLCIPMSLEQIKFSFVELKILDQIMDCRSEAEKNVVNRVAGNFRALTHYANTLIKTPDTLKRIFKRLYVACILKDLINGVTKEECMERYNINSGKIIESLRDDVCRFASKASTLCYSLKQDLLAGTLKKFSEQLWHGANEGIVSLSHICKITTKDARMVYESGLQRPEDIVSKSVEDLKTIFLENISMDETLRDKSFMEKVESLSGRIIESCKQHLQSNPLTADAVVLEKKPSPDPIPASNIPKPKFSTKSAAFGHATGSDMEQQTQPKLSFADAKGAQILRKYSAVFDAFRAGKHIGIYFNCDDSYETRLTTSSMPKNPAKRKRQTSSSSNSGKQIDPGQLVVGIAFAWDDSQHYIRLKDMDPSVQNCVLKELAASLLDWSKSDEGCIAAYDWKHQYMAMKHALHEYLNDKFEDVIQRVVDIELAAWILYSDANEFEDRKGGLRGKTGKNAKSSKTSNKIITDANKTFQSSKEILNLLKSEEFRSLYGMKSDAQATNPVDGQNLYIRNATIILDCWMIMISLLESQGLMKLLLEVEMPICKILGLMELRGVGCDHDFLAALRPKLASLQVSLARKASELAKRVVHLTSHQQVKAVLFEILGLDVPECARRKKQGGQDNVSVDKNVLQELIKKYPNQEFPSIVLKFRKVSDTITDLDSLIRHCTTESYSSVPVIHAQFCQTSAATGRIASDEPNLQCVPKIFDIEDGLDPMVINLRKSIVPKMSSRIIVSADFRHIELRVMAHLSADQSMIKMLQNPLADPFKLLACKWLRVETEEAVTSEQRQEVKHLTYGLLYGMGEQRLGKELNVSAAKAKEMKEDFLNSFPDLANWIKNLIVGCKLDGHVTTLLGRFRWLKGINAEDGKERARCERAAVNSVCQGSAADITKLAMCNIERALHSKYGRTPPCTSVLQIHDELLFEVERDSIREVVVIIKNAMESAVTMSVPLPVQFQYGKSWGELVQYEL